MISSNNTTNLNYCKLKKRINRYFFIKKICKRLHKRFNKYKKKSIIEIKNKRITVKKDKSHCKNFYNSFCNYNITIRIN